MGLLRTALLVLASTAGLALASSPDGPTLTKNAVQLPPGSYTFQNVGNREKLFYAGGASMIPSSRSSSNMILTRVGGYMQVAMPGNTRCMSAAWKPDIGADGWAVPYACIKPHTGRTLKPAKQQWLFVPASKVNSRSIETESPEQSATDAEEELESALPETRMVKRGKPTSTGPGASQIYYIVPYDHLADMAPRALTSKISYFASGDAVTEIDKLSSGEKLQQWIVTRV